MFISKKKLEKLIEDAKADALCKERTEQRFHQELEEMYRRVRDCEIKVFELEEELNSTMAKKK